MQPPTAPPLDSNTLFQLIQPNGEQIITNAVKAFRELHGEKWKEQFCKENPQLVFVIELCANYTGEDAFLKLKEIVAEQTPDFFTRTFAMSTIDLNKSRILNLHAYLKNEITRPA